MPVTVETFLQLPLPNFDLPNIQYYSIAFFYRCLFNSLRPDVECGWDPVVLYGTGPRSIQQNRCNNLLGTALSVI